LGEGGSIKQRQKGEERKGESEVEFSYGREEEQGRGDQKNTFYYYPFRKTERERRGKVRSDDGARKKLSEKEVRGSVQRKRANEHPNCKKVYSFPEKEKKEGA